MTQIARSTSPPSLWTEPLQALNGLDLMTHLYNRLDGMYPNRWRANFTNPTAIQSWKDSWAEAFEEEGVSPTEAREGLRNCRRMYDWPPSLPEFLKACRTGLQPEAAFHEAVAGMSARRRGEPGVWSHQAIYWAAVKLGSGEILSTSYSAIKGRWEKILADVLAAGTWQPIPMPNVALPAPGAGLLSREEAKRRLSQLGASGVLARKNDPKAWAHRIVARVANGEQVASMTVRMAQQALASELRL